MSTLSLILYQNIKKSGRMTPNEIRMLYRFDVYDSVFDDLNLNDV